MGKGIKENSQGNMHKQILKTKELVKKVWSFVFGMCIILFYIKNKPLSYTKSWYDVVMNPEQGIKKRCQ